MGVHARGLGCGREPGLVLREVLDRNGGRYEITMPMGERIREQARICAQVSGDEEQDADGGAQAGATEGGRSFVPLWR